MVFRACLLLALNSGITLSGFGEPYGVVRIEPRLAAYAIQIFCTNITLGPVIYFYCSLDNGFAVVLKLMVLVYKGTYHQVPKSFYQGSRYL